MKNKKIIKYNEKEIELLRNPSKILEDIKKIKKENKNLFEKIKKETIIIPRDNYIAKIKFEKNQKNYKIMKITIFSKDIDFITEFEEIIRRR